MRVAMAVGLAGMAALGCGRDDPVRAVADLRTELVVDSAPAGLEAAVAADSASWYPSAVLPAGSGQAVDIEGPFRFRLRNGSAQAVSLRYDLRFLDGDGFLVDRFIPFGQPLLLEAGEARPVSGTFAIRASLDVGRYGLATMQIAVRVTRQQ